MEMFIDRLLSRDNLSLKTGILTFHNTVNYGASLQALALSQAVRRLGHEAEIIDYQQPEATVFYAKKTLKGSSLLRNLWKYHKFRRFKLDHLPLTESSARSTRHISALLRDMDKVIAGSDQIWHVRGFRGFAPEYFLSFVQDPVRRIAYAPSFGGTTDVAEYRDDMERLLSRFDFLSARDANTSELIRQLTGRDAEIVLDPTFLGSFDNIAKSPTASICERGYILVYALLDPHQVDLIKGLSKRLDVPIVSVGASAKYANISDVSVGPEEWLGYFHHARFVCTTYYHGLIFSILARKPFVLFSTSMRATKTLDLTQRLGLDDRVISSGESVDRLPRYLDELDYSPLESGIELLVSRSRAFLERALNT